MRIPAFISLAVLSVGLLGCRPGNIGVGRPVVSPDVAVRHRPRDASDDFFENPPISELRIELAEAEEQKLRGDSRKYVRATLVENDGKKYYDVAIKLKGAAGSFQEFDGKPAFTLNVSKHRPEQQFHHLRKFHLNNSVQDESYLCEALCSALCLEAGVPTPRVSHAHVWLNHRDLGLYVLKEGFDETFIQRHFSDPSGNLYDGGFCQDIDAELEKDGGKGADDRSDLRALVDACREPDEEKRWQLIERRLDLDAFTNFVALELMCCHWDGYTYSKNNFRLYFDSASGKARFFPHGMDQMFQDPGFPLFNAPEPIVASAFMQNPAWRERYVERIKQLLPQFSATALTSQVDHLDKRLQPAMEKLGAEALANHAEFVRQLKERLVARAENLREQIKHPEYVPPAEPMPLEFNEEGRAELADWSPAQGTEDASHAEEEVDGKQLLTINAGPSGHCVASWRRRVLLSAGKYRLQGQLKTKDVVVYDDEKGRGVGLRISGSNRANEVSGDSGWTTLMFDFEVGEPLNDIELVAELRAERGQVWIQSPLLLIKLDANQPSSPEPEAP